MTASRIRGKAGKPIEIVPVSAPQELSEVEARFYAAAARLHRAQEANLRATMEYIAAREALQAAQRAAAETEDDSRPEGARGATPWS